MFARLHADFNRITQDEQGDRVELGKQGSWQIEQYRPLDWLIPGATVKLSDGELEVIAQLAFDEITGYWYGRPNWATRKDLSSPADGMEELRQFPADKRLIIIRNELNVLIHVVQGGVELLERTVPETTAPFPIPPARIVAGIAKSTKTLREVFDAVTDPGTNEYRG